MRKYLVLACGLLGTTLVPQAASAHQLCTIYNQCWEVTPMTVSPALQEKLFGRPSAKVEAVNTAKPARTVRGTRLTKVAVN